MTYEEFVEVFVPVDKTPTADHLAYLHWLSTTDPIAFNREAEKLGAIVTSDYKVVTGSQTAFLSWYNFDENYYDGMDESIFLEVVELGDAGEDDAPIVMFPEDFLEALGSRIETRGHHGRTRKLISFDHASAFLNHEEWTRDVYDEAIEEGLDEEAAQERQDEATHERVHSDFMEWRQCVLNAFREPYEIVGIDFDSADRLAPDYQQAWTNEGEGRTVEMLKQAFVLTPTVSWLYTVASMSSWGGSIWEMALRKYKSPREYIVQNLDDVYAAVEDKAEVNLVNRVNRFCE